MSASALPMRGPTINEMKPVPVLIVDDQPPFRAVARTVVGMTPGFEVSAEADSGERAVELAADLHPAVVLMDINLGGINGVEATRQITSALDGVVVVLLSTYDADSLPAGSDSCGAARYLHKEDLSPAVLCQVWDEFRPPGSRP